MQAPKTRKCVKVDKDLKPVRVMGESECKKALKNQKKKKQPVRNIVYNPYDEFRPSISEKESDDFSEVWERILNTENISKKIVIEKTGKSQKKQKKGNQESNKFESLELGINAVSRGVKNKTVCGVLLADDVIPKFLVQHVATLCGIAQVPVLIVPSLRKHTKELLGFSSIVFGLKNIVAEPQNPFHEMYCKIKELAEVHGAPCHLKQFKVSYTKKMPTSKSQFKGKITKLSPSSDVYLYRQSNGGRAFIPPRSIVEKKPIKGNIVKKKGIEEEGKFVDFASSSKSNTVEDNDFISINQNNSVQDSDVMSQSHNYWIDESGFVSLSKNEEETFDDLPLQGISYRFTKHAEDEEETTKYRASSMSSQYETTTKKNNYHPPYVPFKYIQVQPNPNKKRKFK